jgi:hypothetical protein
MLLLLQAGPEGLVGTGRGSFRTLSRRFRTRGGTSRTIGCGCRTIGGSSDLLHGGGILRAHPGLLFAGAASQESNNNKTGRNYCAFQSKHHILSLFSLLSRILIIANLKV